MGFNSAFKRLIETAKGTTNDLQEFVGRQQRKFNTA